MTTNFALSLSFEGISLLHRAPDGWDLVGETPLDVEDLSSVLADMRADALRLDPSGLQCKILIPNEQIKFITLETAQTELPDVMAALENATPYAIDELAIDFDRNGGRTFIAAVARETLQEAEAFAVEHGFTPVSMAAVPAPMTFRSEVFFGPAAAAGTAEVTRDTAPTVQTGVAVIPADPDAVPVFTPRARMADPESIAPPAPKVEKTPNEDAPKPVAAPVVAVPTVAAPAAAPPAVPVTTEPAVVKPAPEVAAPPPPKPEVEADTLASAGGFTSRRKAPAADPADAPAKKQTRKEKKAAAFVTKQAQPVRGKPRFLGLILTAILIAFMALVALWASTLTEEEIASLFGFGTGGIVETAEVPPPEIIPEPVVTAPETAQVTAEPPLPQLRENALGQVLSPAEAARIYAATGVWQRAPRLPLEPRTEPLSVSLPALETNTFAIAQPALPQDSQMSPDLAILPPVNPLPLGTDFDRDENGLVRATPEGAMTAQGVMVYAGPPPRKPPLRTTEAVVTLAAQAPPTENGVVVIQGRPSRVPPLRPTNAALPAPEATAPPVDLALAGLRPKLRPADLAPAEVAPEPEADAAVASLRPKTRPAGLAPAPEPEPEPTGPDITAVVAAIAEAAPASPFVSPTSRAVTASSRPDTRPRNFATVVARAQDLAAQQAARAAAQPAAAVATAPSRQSGNTPGSVAEAATYDNAIRLRDVNLIGVYGTQASRRALVRLGNGRYVKVQVGSNLDGGRVTAIGDSALNYVKRGKTIALQLPTG